MSERPASPKILLRSWYRLLMCSKEFCANMSVFDLAYLLEPGSAVKCQANHVKALLNAHLSMAANVAATTALTPCAPRMIYPLILTSVSRASFSRGQVEDKCYRRSQLHSFQLANTRTQLDSPRRRACHEQFDVSVRKPTQLIRRPPPLGSIPNVVVTLPLLR
jgi:hypothetical protein